MSWSVISTWKMSLQGCRLAAQQLAQGASAADALVTGISDVEDNPNFCSVGYGGLPAKDGHVYLDGAFMDGDTLRFGAVGSLEGFRSPIRIARSLSSCKFNNFLVGEGAASYARAHGFEERDNRTSASLARWEKEKDRSQDLVSYDGHDTVCFLTRDDNGTMCAGVSTSGLFLKETGRVGDSPVIGCGFYADSEIGSAAATGVGEEIMKGALSHTAVLYLKAGFTPQEAAEKAVLELDQELNRRNGSCNAMSLIVMDRKGGFGVGTNVEFPFVYASDQQNATLYLSRRDGMKTVWQAVTDIDSVAQD